MLSNSLTLFDGQLESLDYTPPDDRLVVVDGDPAAVDGLTFIPRFITCGEERVLQWEADREGEWSTHWSRRTKSFGVTYVKSAADQGLPAGTPLPQWSDFVRLRLVEQRLLSRLPNQMGVNEYMPGQGIAPHIDYHGGSVVSLTLGSGCVMDFTHPDPTISPVALWLPRRSIVVLHGPARDFWKHGIKGRLKDIVDGKIVRRSRRVSLTFRDVC